MKFLRSGKVIINSIVASTKTINMCISEKSPSQLHPRLCILKMNFRYPFPICLPTYEVESKYSLRNWKTRYKTFAATNCLNVWTLQIDVYVKSNNLPNLKFRAKTRTWYDKANRKCFKPIRFRTIGNFKGCCLVYFVFHSFIFCCFVYWRRIFFLFWGYLNCRIRFIFCCFFTCSPFGIFSFLIVSFFAAGYIISIEFISSNIILYSLSKIGIKYTSLWVLLSLLQ